MVPSHSSRHGSLGAGVPIPRTHWRFTLDGLRLLTRTGGVCEVTWAAWGRPKAEPCPSRAFHRLHQWRGVNRGVGTERGPPPPQPLGIAYTPTQILDPFKIRRPYPFASGHDVELSKFGLTVLTPYFVLAEELVATLVAHRFAQKKGAHFFNERHGTSETLTVL